MASNRIGLEAVLDDKDFQKGMSAYQSGVQKAVQMTQSAASSIGAGYMGMGRSVLDFGATLAKVGFAAAAAGAAALGGALLASVRSAMESEDTLVQLDAILRATGKAATNSKDSILAYADAMSKMTKFDDEAIVAAQTLLLTFDNIAGKTLPGATTAALNLATTFKIDLASAARLVGKALSDPAEGLSALSRVGVKFTEDQETMIRGMVEAGRTAQAQEYILGILEQRMGGTAVAAGTTLSGQLAILRTNLGNVAETVGTALLPKLNSLAQTINEKLASPATQGLVNGLAAALTNLGSGNYSMAVMSLYEGLKGIAGPDIAATVATNLLTISGAAKGFFDVIVLGEKPLGSWAQWERDMVLLGPQVSDALMLVNQQIFLFRQTLFNEVIPAAQGFITTYGPGLTLAFQAVGTIIGSSGLITGLFTVGKLLLGLASPINIVMGLAALLGFVWGNNIGGIQEKTQTAFAAVQTTITQVMPIVQGIIQTALTAISTFWQQNGDTITGVVNTIWGVIQSVFTTVGEFIQRLWAQIVTWTAANWGDIQATIDQVASIVQQVIGALAGFISDNWQTISRITSSVWALVSTTIANAIHLVESIIKTVMALIRGDWNAAWEGIKEIVSTIILQIKNAIKFGLDIFKGLFEVGWNLISKAVKTILKELSGAAIGLITAMLKDIAKKVSEFVGDMVSAGKELIQGMINGIGSMAGALADAAAGLARRAIEAIKKALHMGSPSKVGLALGANFGASIGIGALGALQPAGGMIAQALSGLTASALAPGRVSAPAMLGHMTTVNNTYNLSASYRQYQGEGSLRDTVRLLQAGVG